MKQAATLQWWQEIAPKCEVYVSQYVDDESKNGDPEFAEKRKLSAATALKVDAATLPKTVATVTKAGLNCREDDIFRITVPLVGAAKFNETLNETLKLNDTLKANCHLI